MKPQSMPRLPQGAPILMASPRKRGNCAAIAGALQQSLVCGERPLHVVPLRKHRITPCIACDTCQQTMFRQGRGFAPVSSETPPHPLETVGALTLAEEDSFAHAASACAALTPPFGCPLAAGDDSLPLYEAMITAPALFVVAPIYFYHLPAHFKALIDRLQTFWRMSEAGFPPLAALPPRPCYPVLIAGRRQGERLFEGSLLTLKQALKALGFTLEEPLLLRGLDGPEDFPRGDAAAEAFAAYIEGITRASPLLALSPEVAARLE